MTNWNNASGRVIEHAIAARMGLNQPLRFSDSLDAMARAEATMLPSEWTRFIAAIHPPHADDPTHETGIYDIRVMLQCSARERAVAFLQATEDRWQVRGEPS